MDGWIGWMIEVGGWVGGWMDVRTGVVWAADWCVEEAPMEAWERMMWKVSTTVWLKTRRREKAQARASLR